MSKLKKQTFLQGAIILVIANLVTKIIGAVFKIPLANVLNEDGMGMYTSAYQSYVFGFIIATAGLPIAVSKMVALLPSAAVAPAIHAHWIFEHHPRDTGYYFIRIVCSNCGLKTDGKSKYCPNCGAKMDKEDDE